MISRPQSRKPAAPDDDEGPDADPHAIARAICLRLLTTRARTRSELAAALRKRAVPEDVAISVLDRFGDLGFVDDEAFAQAWVTSRQATRGLAGRALAQELRQRGVADDVAQAAIRTVDRDAETAKAHELVRRRIAAMSGVPAEARYRRLTGMLARKGYPGALASRVVKEALAGQIPERADDHDAFEG